MDDKKARSCNGILYSLATHIHNYITNSGMVGITDAYIENVNDFYGTVRMHMQNRTGVNGVLYEQLGTVDVIDFVFKTLTQQSNIRLEARSFYQNDPANTTGEWQFGPPVLGSTWLVLGNTKGFCYVPLMQFVDILATDTITATSTISGSNLDTSGFSTLNAPVKVYTAVTQAISSTTNTKLVFGTIAHAPTAAAWNAANNRYIAQTAGIFSVKGSIRCTGTARSSKLMIYKNGVFYLSLQDNNTQASVTVSYHGTTDIQLVATDYLELWFYASGTTTVASGLDCNFCVSRID